MTTNAIEQLPPSHGDLSVEDFDRLVTLTEAAGLEAVVVTAWYGGGDDSYKRRDRVIHRNWSFAWEPRGRGVYGQVRRTIYACEPLPEEPFRPLD